MTDKELRKMSRKDLLELLFEQYKANAELKNQLKIAERRLNERKLLMDNAGSIAEAVLQINKVFEVAQDTAEQYLENVRALVKRTEREAEIALEDTKKWCQAMESESENRCAEMFREAKEKSQRLIKDTRNTIWQLADEDYDEEVEL